jgi:DNA primase
MPLWLDKRYINMVSTKLSLFKWKKSSLANFRCPFCGDSQRNKRKARGYLYVRGNNYFYKCHNCPESTNLANFLKHIDPSSFSQYLVESFAEKNNISSTFIEEPQQPEIIIKEWVDASQFKHCSFLSQLPEDHYAVAYIKARQIPVERWDDILYVENMKLFVNENIDPDQERIPFDPHIVILIRNADGQIIGCNGRSMKPQDVFSKYIKAKVNAKVSLVYGLDRLKLSEKVYVFEGEFNSMFVPNAISVGGVNMMLGVERLIGVNKESIIQVVDNDPRNKEVVEAMEKLIDAGYSVVILPGNITSEDVNDMVVKDKLQTIQKILDDNTYSGLRAKLKLIDWKKVL